MASAQGVSERPDGSDGGRAATVVVAAGAGRRLRSSRPKLFVDLAGRPLVWYALSALEGCGSVERIVLVVPAGTEAEVERKILSPFSLRKVERVLAGGETRGESVFAGLSELPTETGTVLIHDGARPFASEDLILSVLEAAERFGAAVPGVECADTLKRVEEEIAVATLDRSRIRCIQTPQGFHYPLVLEAYERARQNGVTAPDDAALVERMGTRVKVVPGSPGNVKITTPEDLELAAALLAARQTG